MDELLLNDLTYRKARFSDIGHMLPLITELAGESSEKDQKRRMRRLLLRPSYHVLVAVHRNEIVGFNILREGLFVGTDAPSLQILSLVVSTRHQKRGIATYLLDQALEKASREGYCQLWGLTQHEHLHTFYENRGFTNTGARFTIQTPQKGRPALARRIGRRLGI